jgi:N-acetylneuraminic acid mutarotase
LKGRYYHSATWTGEEVIVFGGYNYRRSFADGAAYNPLTDRWRRLPTAPIRPRFLHAATSVGGDVFIFGGIRQFGHIAHGDGATYDSDSGRWRRIVPKPL